MIYMEIVTEMWCNKDSCVTVTPSIAYPICSTHLYKSDSLIELSTNKSTAHCHWDHNLSLTTKLKTNILIRVTKIYEPYEFSRA